MIFITESGKEIQVPSDFTYMSLKKFAKDIYEQGRADAIDKVISYLNDCRLIEDSNGCYECISDLMEKIEQLKEQKNDD